MVHIVIFCRSLLKGGSEKQALILSKLLLDQNRTVTLINWCSDKTDPQYLKYLETYSIPYICLEGNQIKKIIRFIRILKQKKITIILSYLTLPNLVAGLSKLFIRDLVAFGGIRNEKLPYYKFLCERFVHNNLSNASIFNNFSAREKFIKRGFKNNKIFVIHNSIENRPVSNSLKALRQDIRIVTISRFVEQKDFHTALYSFKALVDRNQKLDLNYYIAGYGPLEAEIRLLAEKLKISNRVKILINPVDPTEILKDCDIYLSTSLYEGLSNSLMEAMVAGLPIVATNVGDNRYLIESGLNGYLVQCKDIDSIVDKLESLLYSKSKRDEFGELSQKKIKNELSQEIMLKNYLTVFSKFKQV